MLRSVALLSTLVVLLSCCTSIEAIQKDGTRLKQRTGAKVNQGPALLETQQRHKFPGMGGAAAAFQNFANGGSVASAAQAGLATVAGNMAGETLNKLAGVKTAKPPPQPRPYGIGSPQLNGAVGRLSYDDGQCVMCQYIVQRIESEMLMNGIGQITPGQSPQDALAQESQAWANNINDQQQTMQFATPPFPGAPAPGAAAGA